MLLNRGFADRSTLSCAKAKPRSRFWLPAIHRAGFPSFSMKGTTGSLCWEEARSRIALPTGAQKLSATSAVISPPGWKAPA